MRGRGRERGREELCTEGPRVHRLGRAAREAVGSLHPAQDGVGACPAASDVVIADGLARLPYWLAELIEQSFAPWLDPEQVHSVLDLCTGSGCIAIACAYAFEHARVDGSDISEDALAVFEENIARHGMEGQVQPICSDGLSAVQGPYDLIVSNPPYVDALDMANLPGEYRHEPELALASGDDGLDFTRRLLREAPEHLTEQGVLIVEVGNSDEAMMLAWPEVPFFWFEFERGGHGVFMLTRQQLLEYRHVFSA